MTVEDLFAAEAKLRRAARDYSSVEHAPCQQTLECKMRHARDLRDAARAYAKLADIFESALADALKPAQPDCDDPDGDGNAR